MGSNSRDITERKQADPFAPAKGTGLGLSHGSGYRQTTPGLDRGIDRHWHGRNVQRILAGHSTVPHRHVSDEPSSRRGAERILLVEDDLAVRLITQRVLQAFGYQVWEAAPWPDAVGLWGTPATLL
jgi:hypothetical protein